MKLSTVFKIITMLIIASLSIYASMQIVSGYASILKEMGTENDNYHSENRCIDKYISKGIERRDIVRDNGTCKIVVPN